MPLRVSPQPDLGHARGWPLRTVEQRIDPLARHAKSAREFRDCRAGLLGLGDLTPALRETLALWREDAKHGGAADYVIHTATGKAHNPSNLRRDVLAPAVKAANVKLEEQGIAPIGHLTFHGLRRSYASLRCACGDDVRYTAGQLGHTDPRFTLRVYAQATARRDRMAKPQRDAYDAALDWAAMGSNVDLTLVEQKVEAA